ncbi:MAG: MaoC family dehydratase [Sphingomonadaceae bacterium]
MPVASLSEIGRRIGESFGPSEWIAIDQPMIDAFAEATRDRQFIHVDPEAAAQTPLGGTVAHGFLTLSLLTAMAAEAVLIPDTTRMAVNYGFERLRFIAPVPAGARVRGRFTLLSLHEQRPAQWRLVHRVEVEIEDGDRPALTAEWIVLVLV